MARFTSNNGDGIQDTLVRLQRELDVIRGTQWPYPLANNIILRHVAQRSEEIILPPLSSVNKYHISLFYFNCDGISLPDIGNGIFIHERKLLVANGNRRLPVRLETGEAIWVFGSDGGGGLFATFESDRSEVIHMKCAKVAHGIYDNVYSPERRVAEDFSEFLSLVLKDVEAFARRVSNWKYLS